MFNTVLSPLVELSESLLRPQFSKIVSDVCLTASSLFFQGSAFESQVVPAEGDSFKNQAQFGSRYVPGVKNLNVSAVASLF